MRLISIALMVCDKFGRGFSRSNHRLAVARVGRLSLIRAETSKPLDGNSPLLQILMDVKCQDYPVFAVEDTKLAFADKDDPNRNDEAFSREDSSLLVARIFAREKNEVGDSLVGLFYITSAHPYAFDADVIDLFILLSRWLNTPVLKLLDEANNSSANDSACT